MPYDDTAVGEVLDYDVDDMPVRCQHHQTMSGMQTQCDRITGHDGPHRVTATWVDGAFLCSTSTNSCSASPLDSSIHTLSMPASTMRRTSSGSSNRKLLRRNGWLSQEPPILCRYMPVRRLAAGMHRMEDIVGGARRTPCRSGTIAKCATGTPA